MAYMKVDSTKLNAGLTSVSDSIRTKAGTSDKLAFPAGMKEAVDNLNTFVPPSSMALDPDEVYRTTRPKDWLPMPTPGDDEVYLLNLIPEGLDGAFTAQISFTGTCTVEFGNLVDGVFVAKETVTPTSGTRFFHTVYWDDYGDETSDGYRQYLVRIKGSSVSKLEPNPKDVASWAYGAYHLVDAVVGMKTNFIPGGSEITYLTNKHLRYVRFVGNGQLYGVEGSNFRGCESLLSVSAEKQSTGSSMYYFFSYCSSLIALSKNIFITNVNCDSLFRAYGRFPYVDGLSIYPTSCVYLLSESKGNTTFYGKQINTRNCQDFTRSFAGSAITNVLDLDISSMAICTNMLANTRLYRFTFAGETTPGGWTIDCSSCVMSHKALVNMINSLPTALSPATITITNNPGASALTDEEIAVATARNWTVTI